ncbi:Nucleic-acid-binding protein from transposon X-element [Eumeta japonica]|uniref:Nucleic-acid-binding protein from transposon X-element n=1 Tax=Eumeta variegata TaxID=151549 RepID=A0A4C1TBQ2_EUMVA|nr:Nucleic-acid-binding protein from transposon X-element [Eumeta japonica]
MRIAAPRPSRPCRSRVRGAAGRHTPQLIIIYYFRSNRWLPNGVNEAICSEPRALAFPLQGTANPDGPGTTGLGGCSSPIPGVARPPSIIPHSILRTPLASLPWTKIPPCSPGAGGSGPKTPITLEFIQQVLTKALSDIGYEAPQDVVKKLIARVTPVSSRASSRATSPMKTNKNKRQASSSSDEGATCSDSTVVGSDSESENSNTSFTLVEGKNKRALRKALKKAKVARDQPEMDIDPSSAPTSRANDAKPSPRCGPTDSDYETGAKPTAPPRPKLPPPIFLRKGANFLQISADCTRLRINYSKAVRTADDGIKIHCPDVETFRSLNKYLVDFKVQFHTYALEEERKLKAVIRGIPTDFPVDEIQADLCGQGFPVHSVHRLCRRDGSPLWLVLAVLPRTEEAKNIFNNLNMVCGLSGIRVEAPHKKGGPGQCHRCQLYGHAAANCHADPRCVKCLVPHWTRECPRTRLIPIGLKVGP